MQQEEPRETVVADEPEFLVEPREGLVPSRPRGIAPAGLIGADARQRAITDVRWGRAAKAAVRGLLSPRAGLCARDAESEGNF